MRCQPRCHERRLWKPCMGRAGEGSGNRENTKIELCQPDLSGNMSLPGQSFHHNDSVAHIHVVYNKGPPKSALGHRVRRCRLLRHTDLLDHLSVSPGTPQLDDIGDCRGRIMHKPRGRYCVRRRSELCYQHGHHFRAYSIFSSTQRAPAAKAVSLRIVSEWLHVGHASSLPFLLDCIAFLLLTCQPTQVHA